MAGGVEYIKCTIFNCANSLPSNLVCSLVTWPKRTTRIVSLLFLYRFQKCFFTVTKALTKYEEPNVWWDAHFLDFFCSRVWFKWKKKRFKKWAAQQTFGTFCCDRALPKGIRIFLILLKEGGWDFHYHFFHDIKTFGTVFSIF